ncbi:hypothetical protein EZ449_21415 [Pedobacter frigidisoli]|uniref:Uncharacterized protein n=1 Tax=Pedobacter frigidisoli TaxID=2530455 RepID=A0A4R0NFZ9_9SPHI|nr:hypothetical protein [Pedobacter frigidisoli]TCC99088.1 hypothetical protein EZ449_21415 [Pedobacter frigidisoli]
MDKKNPDRKTFILFLENKLVNLILPNKNSKPAFLFFERNRNKFVFNYWIKTVMGGFVSSVGLKKESKLKKQEREAKLKYHLPQQL